MATKLFLALDYADPELARKMVRLALPLNPYFKIGLELFTFAGPHFVREIIDEGGRVFLDLKFHDIPNTVAGAVSSAVGLGVGWLNVHCAGGPAMLEAAAKAKGETCAKLGSTCSLLGVTILTSLDDHATQEIGYSRKISEQVPHFAKMAKAAGLDGVVCSAQELSLVQAACGQSFQTMVPGIRLAGASTEDQKRVVTPEVAKNSGAHCIVMGRPITAAKDPAQVLREVLGVL